MRLAEPQFEGQTKEVLGTPAATRIVSNVVAKELTAWFTTPPRGDKAATKAVLDKHVPPLTTHPAFDQFKSMSLKALEPMSQGAITSEIIAAIQADFDKIK